MRLTDIALNWVLPGAVLLAGIAVAAVVHARGRKDRSGDEGGLGDSWERMEERRRRKEAVYGTASYVLLFCCAAVAAALSFHGLVGFGRQNLNLSGGWEYLVPFGLDGAAMFCSVLAVREASHGDAALGSRLLVWTFAGAAAWFNWVHAPRGLEHAGAPQFFAGMSLSAAVLFDRALKQTRRAALREQGLVPRPLPQIRIVRWLRAPRETFGAWSLMLLEGVRTLDEAVEEVREDRREKLRARQTRRDEEKRERARIKAFNRQHSILRRSRGGRQVQLPGLPQGSAAGQAGAESAIAEQRPAAALPPSPAEPAGTAPGETAGPVLQAVPPGRGTDRGRREAAPRTVDLTAEDDTLTVPRLDSLERKLKEMEQQFG
ncbi:MULTISPECIES: DUF2637 domain-containing protein [Streptomyces]|uniref:DUF2637 domain-containing protein n=1 Tax=Streptomyces lycii TaxID=2654337 RepID=A0ABQ7FKT0_9ACTN|nr:MULTISPECIES: DUF2637 domain-containing protein [Streptomyces]KAF4408959.1 DUF2637 domain-containing protein [Streptomyces lycii]PGH47961.1 hypothetical protein CRI70_25655 [Streptomyces sp. Ru87]